MQLICQLLLVVIVTLLPALGVPQRAEAGTVKLWGIADGDSTYIEEPSDGFVRVDLYDPPPRQTQQRFHLISDPSVTVGNFAYDGFPNDANFRLGSVTYNDADLVNGSGVATITGLSLGVGQDPDDPDYWNYYRWTPLITTPLSWSGIVTVASGSVTSIDLTSNVELSFNPFGTFDVIVPGTFTITGNRFDGYMQFDLPGSPQRLIWDFAGALSTVATPGALIGDYNNNGVVDAADYVIWRKTLGTNYDLPNRSPSITGDVSPDDFTAWRANFGNAAAASGAAQTFSAVPEPTGLGLISAAILGGALSCSRIRKNSRLLNHRVKN